MAPGQSGTAGCADVGAGNETGKQTGLPGIEYLAVKGANAFFHFCSVVHATLLCLGYLIV